MSYDTNENTKDAATLKADAENELLLAEKSGNRVDIANTYLSEVIEEKRLKAEKKKEEDFKNLLLQHELSLLNDLDDIFNQLDGKLDEFKTSRERQNRMANAKNHCEKFIYLDTDVLILQNIDHLFGLEINCNIFMVPDMQVDSDYEKVILIKNRFNSGVVVSNYNTNVYEDLYRLLADNIENLMNSDGKIFVSDQYIFETINRVGNFKINQLDIAYNIHPILVESAINTNLIKEPFIIHFMMKPKPWDILNLRSDSYRHRFENKKCKEYFLLWINMYFELMSILYFKDSVENTNVKTYHWGIYNDLDKLEYQNESI